MSVEVKIPNVGESVTEVEIGDWRKSEGDEVRRDETLVTLETDKASVDVPAPAAGTLDEILRNKGDRARVGEVIAYIDGTGGGSAERDDGERSGDEEQGGSREREEDSTPQDERSGEEPRDVRSDPPRKDRQGRLDERGEQDERGELHEGEDPEESDRSAARRSTTTLRHRPQHSGGPRRVSPLAKKILEEHGLALEGDSRGGHGERVDKDAALKMLEERRGGAGRDASGSDPREERVPMSSVRRTIARRLVEAKREAALLTTFNEVDMSGVLSLRETFGERFRERYEVKLGLMSFFVKAVVDALKRFPALNAEVDGDDIVYKDRRDIGIAVGGGEGLVVPVLRNADGMSFSEIERAIAGFVDRAGDGDIEPGELRGGTFTISNGGVYGSLLSTPIVNPPQSGILGLHRIEQRPVVQDGEIVIRPMMYVALTYDHRIVDGREAVTFLVRIKDVIEAPSRMIFEV